MSLDVGAIYRQDVTTEKQDHSLTGAYNEGWYARARGVAQGYESRHANCSIVAVDSVCGLCSAKISQIFDLLRH